MQNETFNELMDEFKELHDRKNKDYAEDTDPYSNFKEAAANADITVDQVFLVLLGVKQARLRQLIGKGKTAENESVLDSLKDLAVYASIWAAYQIDSALDPRIAQRPVEPVSDRTLRVPPELSQAGIEMARDLHARGLKVPDPDYPNEDRYFNPPKDMTGRVTDDTKLIGR